MHPIVSFQSGRSLNAVLMPWARALLVLCLCAATTIVSHAQTFTAIHQFNTPTGAGPEWMNLVQGRDGNFYGATTSGGAHKNGTIFKITPQGKFTSLYSFCSQANCADGLGPISGLITGPDGNFYGSSAFGGLATCPGSKASGCGTIFKITPDGIFTTLHTFAATDGQEPLAPLLLADNGNLYGTTVGGGAYSNGTIFKITPAGTFTTLYSFCAQANCPDGLWPTSGLIQGRDGNFYGATFGSDNLGGTVYKFTPAGKLSVLASFCALTASCPNGSGPSALVEGNNGALYGTTYFGGVNGVGSVYKLTKSGTIRVLWSFTNGLDGSYPYAALTLANDGNFYGTTEIGGDPTGSGVIFEITPDDVLTPLYDLFCNGLGACSDGSNPYGGLTEGTDGILYGTTFSGGDAGGGTVFSLALRFLGPFVEAQPTLGKVATPVRILGTNLTGATSVSFNGVAANFTVVSSSEITTSVPTGASTGYVTVTTPSKTLTSNLQFRVVK